MQGPPLVVPQATQIRLLGGIVLTPNINVLHAINPGGVTINQALANTLGTAIKSAYTTNLASHVPSNSGLFQVGVRDLRTVHMAEYLDSGAIAPGSGTGDYLPGQNAVCVTLRTAKAGQSFRGRVYLGGFTETDNTTTGAIATGLSNACVAFVTAIQSALNSNGLQLAVLSRPAYQTTKTVVVHHGDGSEETQTHVTAARAGEINAVVAIVARNTIWDTQRRRAAQGSSSSLFMPPVSASYDGDMRTSSA